MPQIEIFRAGNHVDTAGKALAVTAGDLAGIAARYDRGLHEAPVVVGHPTLDAPAYGWVKGLKVDGDRLVADLDQVDASFADLVKAGRFKKVSASFYLPEAPNNPTKGQLSLRHVGFLGAAAPAVKGLKAVAFADGEAGIADFTDWNDKTMVRLFRGMRDFLVEKFGTETADKHLPADSLNWLQEDVAVAASKPDTVPATFSDTPEETDLSKTQEQLDAERRELEDSRNKLAADQASFAEQQAKARADQVARESADFVDHLVAEGKFLPANKARAVAIMGSLALSAATIDFADVDGKPVTASPLDHFKSLLASSPKVVDLSEVAAEDKTAADFADQPAAVADKAREYQDAEAAKGRTVSTSEAVRHVLKGANQ